jgi:asparagine synthase (glutamine-hydrolysing)
MSAILGIINRNGKPAENHILEKMMKPMSYWGPDGKSTWCKGPAALGHLALHNTPESQYEKFPLKSSCGNYTLISSARLDNREELLRTFAIPLERHTITPDSTLIMEAYLKWGEDSPNHLLGDWVFALWDVREKKLFLARDHHGTGGIYYFNNPSFFAFSSGLKGLLALSRIPRRLNELRVAQILTAWPQHGAPTVYEGIYRLPPAHYLTVTSQNVTTKRYWYLENTPRLRFKSDDQYVESFLEIYSEAVRCRLRSARPVGIALSGGLDSGSVAAIAASELRKKGKPLLALCAASKYDTTAALPNSRFEDSPFAHATAQFVGNIDLNFILSEHITPLQGIKRGLDIHDEPVHAASNQYWLITLWEEARNRQVGAMLTGAGGNATISWNSAGYLAQLARQLHWITLIRELKAWKKIHQKSFMMAIKRHVLKPLLPLSMKRWYYLRRNSIQPWENHSAINPNFARRLDLTKEMQRQGHDSTYSIIGDTRRLRFMGIKPGRNMMGYRFQQTGAGFALEIRDPTMDRRVMEYCLAIPDDQYLQEGKDRFLIRRAMTGILPPDVLTNPGRGLQAADIYRRLRLNSGQIRDELKCVQQESRLAREILDIKKLWDVLISLEHEITPRTSPYMHTILLRGLMVGLFLHDFERGYR